MITDFGTIAANISAAQRARAIAAAGPIMDVDGNINVLTLRCQEMKALINYILFGNQIGSGSAGQAGAIFQSGDSNASTTTTPLTNIYNNLS